MVTRHELLSQMHDLLRPKKYLEIGVQYGKSLGLAIYSEVAIGVDPHPLCQTSGNQQIFPVTSDDFFTYYMPPEESLDLAFIDGSHLFEDALRDFINIERHSHRKTVVVFDDVLPLGSEMTSRVMVPGHWTGDVWKVYEILRHARHNDLQFDVVDTEPTGTMVVWNLNPHNNTLAYSYQELVDKYIDANYVPEYIINRTLAVQPDAVVSSIREWLNPC